MCYEVYYYTFNFKPEILLEETDANSINNYKGLYGNEDCDICSNLDKCSFSDCDIKENMILGEMQSTTINMDGVRNKTQLAENNLEKLKNVSDSQMEFLEKSTTNSDLKSLSFMIEKLNQELNITNTNEKNQKNEVDRNLLKNYVNIIKIKLDLIINNLDFLKTINDNSKDLIKTLSKYKKANFTSVLERKDNEEVTMKNYMLAKQKVKDLQKNLWQGMRQKDLCGFFSKLSLLVKEVEDVASDFHDTSYKLLNSARTVISKNLS